MNARKPRTARIEFVTTRSRSETTPGATNYRLLHHVRIRGANGRILMASESYHSKTAARRLAVWLWRVSALKMRDIDETGDAK
jgi:hypothetical protein